MKRRLRAIVAVLCTLAIAITPTFAAWGDDDNDASSGTMTATAQNTVSVDSGKVISDFTLDGKYFYETLGTDTGKTTLTLSTSALQRIVKEKLLPQWSPVAASVFRDQAGQLVDLYGYHPDGGNMSQLGFDAYFNMSNGVNSYKDEKWSCYNLSHKLGQTYASHDGDPGWDQFVVSGVKQVNSLSGARNMVGQALYDCQGHKGLKANEFLDVDEGDGSERLDALDSDDQTTGFANLVTAVNCKGSSSDFDYVTFGIVFYDFEPVPVAAKNLKYIIGEFLPDEKEKSNLSTKMQNEQQQEVMQSALLGDSVTETTSTTLSGLASFKMSENIGANISWSETESESMSEVISDDDFFGTSTSTSSETTTMGLNWGAAWEMAGALGAEVGHSKSVEVSKAVETTIALPPHTYTTIDQKSSTNTYTQTYQQPAILNYKVAIFATSGDYYTGGSGGINPSSYDKQSLVIKFDTKDEATPFYGCVATDDLYGRIITNIGVQGYDVSDNRTYSTHSTASGWKKSEDINWDSVMSIAQSYYGVDVVSSVAKKNFFFESPGKLNVEQDKSTSEAKSINPLYDLASVKTSKTNYVLYSNNTLDKSALAVQGYNKFGVPFYGFSSELGEWNRCNDKGEIINNGNLLSNDPVDIVEEGLVPKAGTDGGTMYFKWVPNPAKKPITGQSPEGQDLEHSNIDSPIVTVIVRNVGLDDPKVTAEGSYTGFYKTPLDLNNVITYEVTDSDDMIIVPQVKWESREQNTGNINVNAGTGYVSFTKPGVYNVRPYVINNNNKKVYSNWISITATEHNFVHYDAKAPTCDTDGWIEHYRCADCGKYFSNASDSAEIPATDVFVEATGHDWGEWITTQEGSGDTPGKQQRVCKTDASHVEERDVYTVKFEMNGYGTAPEKQTFASNAKASVTVPPEPTAAGYTFEGWFTDEGCTTSYDFGAAVEGNLTLYAKWSPAKYTVATMAVGDVFVGEDGEEKVNPVAHGTLGIEGEEGEVKTATETEEGYTYTYYYKEVEYGKPVTLTVTPQANYGLMKIQAVPVNADSSMGEPFTPTKNDTNPVTYSFNMPAADVAVVASFGQESVTITYNANKPADATADPTDVPDAETIPYNSAPTKLESIPKLDGYNFGGWFTDEACKKPCLKGSGITENTTLYAKWTKTENPPVTYTVAYTLSWEPEDANDPGKYEDSYQAEADSVAYDPTEDLYSLAGKNLRAAYELYTKDGSSWFTDSDLTKPYNINAPVTEDIHLYAKVVPRTYSVKYFDGQTELGTQNVTYNTAIGKLGIKAPTKDGYTLSGWATRGVEWNIESDPVTSNLNLYASWMLKKTTDGIDISKAQVTLAQTSFTYDGKAKQPAVKSVVLDGKTLKAGEDFTLSYKDNVNAGTATVTVTGKGNYTGSALAKFTIVKPSATAMTSIAKAKVTLAKTSFVFDGKAKKPAVKSVVLDGKTLKAGVDYAVSYSNNTKLGTAIANVNGMGSYMGTARATFAIGLGKAKLSTVVNGKSTKAIKTKWGKVAGATKYQLQYKVRGGKWKTKTVKSVAKNVKGLKAGKLYDVRVRAVNGKIKGAWSKVSHRWLAKTNSVTAKSTKAGTVKVTWKKVSKANAGYQVLVRYSKKGAIVAKKNVKAGKKAVTVKGLKAGKKAWVEVRALRKAGKTVYTSALIRAKSPVKVAGKATKVKAQSAEVVESSGLMAAGM